MTLAFIDSRVIDVGLRLRSRRYLAPTWPFAFTLKLTQGFAVTVQTTTITIARFLRSRMLKKIVNFKPAALERERGLF
jgi:hypothetical protein